MFFGAIPLQEVQQSLDENLSKLEQAVMQKPVSFREFCEICRGETGVNSAIRDMVDLEWATELTGRCLKSELQPDKICMLNQKTYQGVRKSRQAAQTWKDSPEHYYGLLHLFPYFKRKSRLLQERTIKDILAFEPYIDAHIALRHTNEFADNYSPIRGIQLPPVGYHEPGIVFGNLIYHLKELTGINPEYKNLREKFRH